MEILPQCCSDSRGTLPHSIAGTFPANAAIVRAVCNIEQTLAISLRYAAGFLEQFETEEGYFVERRVPAA